MTAARAVRVRGVVQGVGFRPYVFQLARAHALTGWVLNADSGVEIHVEGAPSRLEAFVRELGRRPPPAAAIAAIDVRPAPPEGCKAFVIRDSERRERPTARISPDLAVCGACRRELLDAADPRFHYPYINCTHCGPRFSIVVDLPYDRARTTMRAWPMCERCASQYRDPRDRRFHAQPVACPSCGPAYALRASGGGSALAGEAAVRSAARLLASGEILAVKGLGGYHLACDARNLASVRALRERKFRKERPFAVMARDLDAARDAIDLSDAGAALMTSSASPIVLARARADLPAVAPDNRELGVMLPSTPLHHLLFACGAPPLLVMTSGNRSSEPIAYEDADARERLGGIADAFLMGERPIARRVDDSVVRDGPLGPVILRRSRGYAPGAVAALPGDRPILAVGADLKNAVTLVVGGQAFVSQHVGDLDEYASFKAFEDTIHDLVRMYEVAWDELLVVHDAHPEYRSTVCARALPARAVDAVQHHRAHVASVLAERGAWHTPVIAASFDGSGFGDDGSIWGGEMFAGSLAGGFERVGHLRPARLAGGDAAARHPVQAAAGFLAAVPGLPDFSRAPFAFPSRYQQAAALLGDGVRVFETTSMGRLFDAAAALLGFTREMTFEGQAAMWLEHLAWPAADGDPYPFPVDAGRLDYVPLLAAIVRDRIDGRAPAEIARAFHRGVAAGAAELLAREARTRGVDTIVLSGGVFQNDLLMRDMVALLGGSFRLWTNQAVPPNDGGISLGQAAVAALRQAAARTEDLCTSCRSR